MQVDEKTLAWGKDKLMQFKEWRDFPKSADSLRFRVELFVKMVENRTAREIIQGQNREWDPEVHPCGIGNDTNDTDWLLETIAKTCERFPSHATMRRMYSQYFTLPDKEMLRPIFDVLNPD
jgi:hypothetical protein